MNKYNLFSPNTDNQTLADSLYKSKKKTKKRKIRILPFFIKKCLRILKFSPSEYAIYDSKSWSTERFLTNIEK
jgi:hypothetical protein